jgi:CheY-like chemotaxis protein
MNIFGTESEQQLIDFLNEVRIEPRRWRALHFHFSSLQPEHRQPLQMQTVVNIIQAELGRFVGAVYVCRDFDLIIIFEPGESAPIDTMITNLRFLFSDDPLASSAFVSGQNDAFFTSFDLSLNFETFFTTVLHKLSVTKPEDQKHEDAPKKLPPLSVFQHFAQERPARKQVKILVAEDSFFSRQLIRQALTPNKHDVLLAKDGWEGLAEYMAHAPDIAFLDITMPQMTGLEVLNRIHEFDREPFIVMLTASNTSSDIKSAIAGGAKGYIVKPFTVGKLVAYVDQFCRERNRSSLAR